MGFIVSDMGLNINGSAVSQANTFHFFNHLARHITIPFWGDYLKMSLDLLHITQQVTEYVVSFTSESSVSNALYNAKARNR